jgi:two-component system OmpR family response regulator
MMNQSDRREVTFGELARSARRQTSIRRIVIADDDPDSLELLKMALANPQIEICEAANGAELVDLLAEGGPFDLVVTDVLMPWMEGLQVLLSARAAEIRTPVLVITGLTRPDLQDKVDHLGNAKLLRKPFAIPELRAAVVDLMARQQLA